MIDIIMIMLVQGLVLGIVIGYVKFDIFRWTKIKNNITKKNNGVVYFVTKGKAIFPVIKNFDFDTIKTMKGIWILNKRNVYRQVKPESPEPKISGQKLLDRIPFKHREEFDNVKDKTFTKHHTIIEKEIGFRQGLPVVFFDIENMHPLTFHERETKDETSNPYQVDAVLSKEIAANEALAIKSSRKSITTLLYVSIILSIVVLSITGMLFIGQTELGSQLNHVTSVVSAIHSG